MKYVINRPPLAETFYLPSKEELLKLKVGDLVKIIFSNKKTEIERMWVKIIEQKDIALWIGELDNDPVGKDLKKILKSGDKVEFHPLDIIQIWNE